MDAPAPKTNLVAPAVPRVGRDRERAALAEDFEEARLVTLLGPGGAGKTTLATDFALERVEAYSEHGGGGCWMVDLRGATSTLDVCAATMAALGASLGPEASDVVAEVGRRIAQRRRVLLVLDNCEPVRGAVAAAVAEWLQHAPRAHLLATSRVALGLAAEQVRPLEGLPAADATELFMRCARRVNPALQQSEATADAIASIVERLGGLPLALELAAARTRALTVEQLRDRLDLSLLARSGEPGDRHRSMARVIAESVDALSPAARGVFIRSAVFAQGFTLEAAEAVLGSVEVDVLAALEELVEHSLLRLGSGRFSSFETIGEVGRVMLAQDPDAPQVRTRHAHYFAQLASSSGEARGLRAELENLLAAQAFLASVGDRARALELALALAPRLALRGQYRHGLERLDQSLASSSELAPRLLARAFLARGQAHRELGDLPRAAADFEASRSLAESIGAPTLRARTECRLGELIEVSGGTETARARYRRALEILDAEADSPSVQTARADTRALLGHALRREGALTEASAELARAEAIYRTLGREDGLGSVAYERGVIALFNADLERTRAFFEQGLAHARAAGARQLEAAIRSGLGVLAQEHHQLDEAIEHHSTAASVFEELGNLYREGSALYYLATTYIERGELGEAHVILDRSARSIGDVGASRYQVLIGGARAAAHALGGQPALAERALSQASAAMARCPTEPSLVATLAIHRLHLLEDGSARSARADSLVAEAAGDDPRCARRLLLASDRGARAQSWLVAVDGARFRSPDASEWVELGARPTLRRVLAALVRHRLESPGGSLGLDELLEAGWPAEKMSHRSANNRVHVALSTLRKLGLREVLQTAERGYRLDPSVGLRVE